MFFFGKKNYMNKIDNFLQNLQNIFAENYRVILFISYIFHVILILFYKMWT